VQKLIRKIRTNNGAVLGGTNGAGRYYKLLLDDGADPNFKDRDGDTPVMNCLGGPAADDGGKATSCVSL